MTATLRVYEHAGTTYVRHNRAGLEMSEFSDAVLEDE
jgi:hypothetical protein